MSKNKFHFKKQLHIKNNQNNDSECLELQINPKDESNQKNKNKTIAPKDQSKINSYLT